MRLGDSPMGPTVGDLLRGWDGAGIEPALHEDSGAYPGHIVLESVRLLASVAPRFLPPSHKVIWCSDSTGRC